MLAFLLILLPPPDCTLPVAKQTTTTYITYRQPHGHTHTCARGHTWDHTTNPSHVCKICGLTQYNQDAVPRMVTVVTKAASSFGPVGPCGISGCPCGCAEGGECRCNQKRPVAAPVLRLQQSNCPSGNCPLSSNPWR